MDKMYRTNEEVFDFFKDKDGVYHMVVATSQANATNPAVYMFDRVSDTTKPCGFKKINRTPTLIPSILTPRKNSI